MTHQQDDDVREVEVKPDCADLGDDQDGGLGRIPESLDDFRALWRGQAAGDSESADIVEAQNLERAEGA